MDVSSSRYLCGFCLKRVTCFDWFSRIWGLSGRKAFHLASEWLVLVVSSIQGFSWLWVKKKSLGDHRFWSIFPFTNRVFWVPFFDPQPYVTLAILEGCPGLSQYERT